LAVYTHSAKVPKYWDVRPWIEIKTNCGSLRFAGGEATVPMVVFLFTIAMVVLGVSAMANSTEIESLFAIAGC
jgi:hypothetical protein